MKNFLLRLLVFGVILLFLDRFFIYILHGYQPENYELFIKSKNDYFKERYSTSILVLGDSHIADAVDPEEIENVIGKRTFNLAIYHSSPVETYYYLKYILKKSNSIPQVIILGTNPIMFSRPLKSGKYTPLLISDTMIKLELYISTEFNYGLLSKFAREKYLVNSIFDQQTKITNIPFRKVNRVFKGYNDNTNSLNEVDSSNFKFSNAVLIYEQIDYFKKCIELAEKNGIRVIFANPPIFISYLNNYKEQRIFENYERVIAGIIASYDILVFNKDYRQIDNFEMESFYDLEHLNSVGSKKYSIGLAHWLKINSVF